MKIFCPEKKAILLLSSLGGGSFIWEDIFGDYGNNFSLYGDSLGLAWEGRRGRYVGLLRINAEILPRKKQ